MKLKVGQKVILARTRSDNPEWIETTVTEVGRKYFKVAAQWRSFSLESGREVSANGFFQIYESEQAILDEKEYNEKRRQVYSFFSSYGSNLTLDQIRQIHSIINPEKK